MKNSIFAHRSKVVAQNNFHSYDILLMLTMTCIGEDGTSSQIHIMGSLYSTYSGKVSGKKTFVNFKVLWLFVNIFFVKFGGVVSFGSTSKQSMEVFSVKNFIFHQFMNVFYLESFPLYGTYYIVIC